MAGFVACSSKGNCCFCLCTHFHQSKSCQWRRPRLFSCASVFICSCLEPLVMFVCQCLQSPVWPCSMDSTADMCIYPCHRPPVPSSASISIGPCPEPISSSTSISTYATPLDVLDEWQKTSATDLPYVFHSVDVASLNE